METTHTIGIDLAFGHRTVAMLSVRRPKSIVVFVHGFGGKAQSTWKGFPLGLQNNAAFASTDVVFFGYKSKRQAVVSARELLELLSAVLSPSASDLYPSEVGRRGPINYRKVILVSHSLGALVTRRALFMARNQGVNWLARVKFMSFAPAHRGCHMLPLLITCLPGLSKVAGLLTYWRIPVLNDLSPGATALTDLERDTNAVVASGVNQNIAIASEIIWADNERVVIPGNFCNDPDPQPGPGQNHMSVCKPTLGYPQPLRRVAAAL